MYRYIIVHLYVICRNMNGTMEQILKCVQGQQNRRRTVKKPACLPICTNTEMMAFETINEDIYEEVVRSSNNNKCLQCIITYTDRLLHAYNGI